MSDRTWSLHEDLLKKNCALGLQAQKSPNIHWLATTLHDVKMRNEPSDSKIGMVIRLLPAYRMILNYGLGRYRAPHADARGCAGADVGGRRVRVPSLQT